MHSKISRKRQGIALIVVLIVVLIASMLGYMGVTMAANDTKIAGGVMDSRSRDAASRSGIEYTLKYLSENGPIAANLINTFIADSSKSILATRQWIDFSGSEATIVVNDPGFQSIASQPDLSAFKIRILSVDIGTQSGPPTDGIKITFECTAQGRRGDVIVNAATFRAFGLQVPVAAGAGTPTNNFAMYLNGSLANSNMGTTTNGNVYISGSTSLNSSAGGMTVNGKFRVQGTFSSNTPLSVSDNAVIGGDIFTNSGAPMTFQKNLVVKGGTQVINAPLTVNGNLEIGGSNGGNWVGALTVGGQYWSKAECKDVAGKVTVTGNTFMDACMRLTGATVNSFSNLYIGRNGGNGTNYFNTGTTTISGNLGVWHTSNWGWNGWSWTFLNTLSLNGGTVTVSGDAVIRSYTEQWNSGKLTINGPGGAQFWGGIGNIASASGITVTNKTFLRNTQSQQQINAGNGYLNLGNDLTMTGDISPNFGSWNQAWRFTGSSKVWKYEAASALSGNPNPRVGSATTNNTTAWNAQGTLTLPSDLFTAPAPIASTSYASDAYTSEDLNLDPAQNWNKPQTADYTKLGTIVDMTDANLLAAGVPNGRLNNLTAADFQMFYNKYKRADGWLVANINSGRGLSAPGGTFSGKAVWVVSASVNVNGNWPGSTGPSDYQFIWVRTGGSLGNFGSPNNFVGYIRFDPAYTGTMQWGTSTLTGAIHFAGGGSSVTGNSGNLTIVNSQAVFDAIGSAFPGILSEPGGTSSTSSTVSTGKLQSRGKLQFITVANYR